MNLLTGELTERIGEVVLDGSEEWIEQIIPEQTNKRYRIRFITKRDNGTPNIICDRILSVPNKEWFLDRELIEADGEFLSIRKTFNTLEEFKSWLSNNPMTVQYQLATESVKTVDLNVVDQSNTKIDKIHVFNETTHVNASSDELTPTVNIGKSVSYPTIIKPNTKYTVDLKRNDKPLTVNLGGTEATFTSGETRKTITTPSTLTNDKLSYYGVGAKCNKIMLIEGEVEGNVDYFTGMQSVVMQNQMPILHTVGKNLFDLSRMNESSYIGYNALNEINLEENSVATTNRNSASTGRGYVITGLKIGVPYTITATLDESSNTTGYFQIGNRQGTGYHEQRQEFTPGQTKSWEVYSDVGSLRLAIAVAHDVSNQYIKFKNIQIEESPTPTTYEPHKSSILSCNEDITLRGIGEGSNRVEDKFNCLTGEVTSKIEEVLIDCNNYLVYGLTEVNNLVRFYVLAKDLGVDIPNKIFDTISDKFISSSTAFGDSGNLECVCAGYSAVYFKLNKNRLSEITQDGVVNWFKSNPTTVCWVANQESIKTVDLDVVDQDGNAIPKIKSYKDVTHLEVTVPKQSLLPHISAEVATDNSKDMSLLTTKHQEISEAQSAIEDNIQSQSDEIDTAMMATTEIFESILE